MTDTEPAMARSIGSIDPDQYLAPERQRQLIDMTEHMPASAIRMAIREAVHAAATGTVVEAIGD